MRRCRTTLTLLLLSLLCSLPGMTAGGQGDPTCPVPTAVPFMPGPDDPVCAVPPPCDPPTPVVKLKVRVPACGKPGEPVEYQIRVENCSAADAHHVVVMNALPANARFLRASPEPHAKEPELQWRFGTMKAGGGCDISLILQPTNQDDLRNCTRVAFEHGQCVTTRFAALPPEVAPESRPPEIVPIPKAPDGKKPPVMPGPDELPKLSLSIEGPRSQYLNLTTRYFLTVANKGSAPATNLLVDLALADKTVFLKASDEGKYLEGKVAWLLGALAPGASRTVVVEFKSQQTGEICQKATALADRGIKAQAEFCTLFGGVSALLLEMVDTEDPIAVGGGTSYPILVRNTGTAPVTNLQIRAIIPEALQLTRAKGPGREPTLGEPQPGAKVLVFDLPNLAPGAQADYTIFVQGARPADARFRIEMRADQLESGPVIEEESTRIYAEDNGATALPLIRNQSRAVPYQP